MSYLRHNGNGSNGKRSKPVKKAEPPQEPSGIKHVDVNALNDVAASMDAIERAIVGHFNNAYTGENKLQIFTGPSGSGYHPILIALEDSDTMDRIIEASERIATAFERIADAVTAKTGKNL